MIDIHVLGVPQSRSELRKTDNIHREKYISRSYWTTNEQILQRKTKFNFNNQQQSLVYTYRIK
jgi:hypothetical protein